MATKFITERNLDGKTIQKTNAGTEIEVKVAPDEENLLKVTEEGLKVEKPNTVKLTSLGGKPLGEVIVD